MGLGLAHRRLRGELMDDPALDPGEHRRALTGVARLNTLGRSVALLMGPMRAHILAHDRNQPRRLLDIACGCGTLTRAIARQCAREGLNVEVAGCDVSETALTLARAGAETGGATQHPGRVLCADAKGAPHTAPFGMLCGTRFDCPGAGAVSFFHHDVVSSGVPGGYDIYVVNLFLHHLTDAQARDLLAGVVTAGAELVVVTDLHRGWASLASTWLATRVVSRSRVVHVDGPRSIEAAFTAGELRRLAEEAGMGGGVRVTRHVPGRLRLVWRRSP